MTKEQKIMPKAIIDFRKKKGLSKQQLASMLNVGVASLSRWEKGTKEPTGSAAAILAALIGGANAGVMPGIGLLVGSGYAIYRLLKERFEGEEEKAE